MFFPKKAFFSNFCITIRYTSLTVSVGGRSSSQGYGNVSFSTTKSLVSIDSKYMFALISTSPSFSSSRKLVKRFLFDHKIFSLRWAMSLCLWHMELRFFQLRWPALPWPFHGYPIRSVSCVGWTAWRSLLVSEIFNELERICPKIMWNSWKKLTTLGFILSVYGMCLVLFGWVVFNCSGAFVWILYFPLAAAVFHLPCCRRLIICITHTQTNRFFPKNAIDIYCFSSPH